jgi:hypothetical protein
MFLKVKTDVAFGGAGDGFIYIPITKITRIDRDFRKIGEVGSKIRIIWESGMVKPNEIYLRESDAREALVALGLVKTSDAE